MTAPRDTERRVLADCPCSGCNATRVLADVETALRREIRDAVVLLRAERVVCDEMRKAYEADPTHHRAIAMLDRGMLAQELECSLKRLLRVRRAARGGRDGGKACP